MKTVLQILVVFIITDCSYCTETSYFEMAATGRPFHLGMLYDARTENIVPGRTLWNKENMDNHKMRQTQKYSSLDITTCNSLSDRALALSLTASLKMSALSGLLEMSGVAKLYNKEVTTAKQSSVVMTYKTTSYFEQLTTDVLNDIDHNEAINDGLATHVVVGILYGNDAAMEFTETFTYAYEKTQVDAKLLLKVDALPQFSINAEGTVNFNTTDETSYEGIDVTFYGDMILEKNPTNYEEAIAVYTKLPILVSNGQYTPVPVRIYLYPISKFSPDSTSQLLNSISEDAIYASYSAIDVLDSVYVSCNDYMSEIYGIFPNTYAYIEKFQSYVYKYKLNYQQKLTTLLYGVRSGTKDNSDIIALNTARESSNFGTAKLKSYLSFYQYLVKILISYTSSLEGIITSQLEWVEKILDRSNEWIVSLEINTKVSQSWLTQMKEHLDDEKRNVIADDDLDSLLENLIKSKNILSSFKDFYENNNLVVNTISFVIFEVNVDSKTGCYPYVTDTNNNKLAFTIPSRPGKPSVTVNYKTVTLSWTASDSSTNMAIEHYEIQYMDMDEALEWEHAGYSDSTQFEYESSIAAILQYKIIGWDANKVFRTKASETSDSVAIDMEATCSPPVLNNGAITNAQSFYELNQELTYECNTMYSKGSNSAICEGPDKWSDVPKCNLDRCETPIYANSGLDESQFHAAEAELELTCAVGYENNGDTKTTCQSVTFTWDETQPRCERIFCTPGDIDNGFVSTKRIQYGETAEYSCHQGYELIGTSVVTCYDNKKSFNNPPHCNYKQCLVKNWASNKYSQSLSGLFGIHTSGSVELKCDPDTPRMVLKNGNSATSKRTTCRNEQWDVNEDDFMCIEYCAVVFDNAKPFYLKENFRCDNMNNCKDMYGVKLEHDKIDHYTVHKDCKLRMWKGRLNTKSEEYNTFYGATDYKLLGSMQNEISSLHCKCHEGTF